MEEVLFAPVILTFEINAVKLISQEEILPERWQVVENILIILKRI